MDEKSARPSVGSTSTEQARPLVDNAISAHVFGTLRTALSEYRGEGLSPRASELLHEICSEARIRGVPPEQIIARVKEEIRSIERFIDDGRGDRDRERLRLERAVTQCIQSFYATAAQRSE